MLKMQKDNGLFILEVADNYLDTLEDSVHEGDLGAGKVLKIWEDILTNAADETKVKIERISDFQSLINTPWSTQRQPKRIFLLL